MKQSNTTAQKGSSTIPRSDQFSSYAGMEGGMPSRRDSVGSACHGNFACRPTAAPCDDMPPNAPDSGIERDRAAEENGHHDSEI